MFLYKISCSPRHERLLILIIQHRHFSPALHSVRIYKSYLKTFKPEVRRTYSTLDYSCSLLGSSALQKLLSLVSSLPSTISSNPWGFLKAFLFQVRRTYQTYPAAASQTIHGVKSYSPIMARCTKCGNDLSKGPGMYRISVSCVKEWDCDRCTWVRGVRLMHCGFSDCHNDVRWCLKCNHTGVRTAMQTCTRPHRLLPPKDGRRR